MKTNLIYLLLLIACISCGTNNKPVSDAQREKIKGEVKEVVNTIIKGSEEANFDMASESWLDSPDFVFLSNGATYNYKEAMALKPVFSTILNQKCTILNEKYSIIDNSTVLYTSNSKWAANFKDGHSTIEDPEAIMILFKKIDNKWKATYFVDSFIGQVVPGASSKELNQVELIKQLLGSWKVNMAKDTILFWEAKPFGTGFESYYKTVAKGKMLMEAKQLFGYDKKIDKFVASNIVKGMDIELWVLWFTSKNKYVITSYSDLLNPDNPSFKVDGVVNSPNEYTETIIVNGKTAGTYKYVRIK